VLINCASGNSTFVRIPRLNMDRSHKPNSSMNRSTPGRPSSDVTPVIAERDRSQKDRKNSLRSLAEDHLLRVILVFRYGEPRIEEPLALAYRRALSKLDLNRLSSLNHIRRVLKEEPPAGDINAKISKSVRPMPYWLRHRGGVDLSMKLLGLEIPPLLKKSFKSAATKPDRDAWQLPHQSMFKPRSDYDEKYRFVNRPSTRDLIRYLRILRKPDDQWTWREHKFYEAIDAVIEWTY
jgi:hypothetical protein